MRGSPMRPPKAGKLKISAKCARIGCMGRANEERTHGCAGDAHADSVMRTSARGTCIDCNRLTLVQRDRG